MDHHPPPVDHPTLNPVEAKQYRFALQQLKHQFLEEDPPMSEGVPETIRCDRVETASAGGRGSQIFLILSKDGENIASVPLTKADLSRLKRDFSFWKTILSGSVLQARHGNYV